MRKEVWEYSWWNIVEKEISVYKEVLKELDG